MLKFFRKIRHQLIKENSFSKYLLYAAGEILLVMIGILLALQVNNWNENQKVKAIELEYLKSLNEEFAANLEELDTFIALNKRVMQATEDFLAYTSPSAETISIKQMNQLTGGVFASSVEYEPNPGILEDLISSGNLNTITNIQLRKQLSLWKAKLARARKQENTVLEHRANVKNLFSEIGNMRKMLAEHLQVPPGNFQNNSKAILRDVRLENYLSFFLISSKSLDVWYYKNLRAVNVQILESIQQEMK